MAKRVRIATIGWKSSDKAVRTKDVETAYQIPWIEFIDGDVTIRVSGRFFSAAEIHFAGGDFTTTSVEFVVAPEIVFVDDQGKELP